jgi:hypothetical protein
MTLSKDQNTCHATFKNNILSRLIIFVLFVETIAIFLFLGFCVYKLLFFKKILQGSNIVGGETTLIGDINKIGFRIIILIFVSALCCSYAGYTGYTATLNLQETQNMALRPLQGFWHW